MGYSVRMLELDPQSPSYTQNVLSLLWHSLYKYKKKCSEERWTNKVSCRGPYALKKDSP